MKTPVTIKDIASTLGMSHSTVSRALNGRSEISAATTLRVRQAATSLGYIANQSARAIRGDAELQVGLLIPDVQNDFFATIAKTLGDLCRKNGLRLLLGITEDDPVMEEAEIRALLGARVAGILANLTSEPTQATHQLLRGQVCVQFGEYVPTVEGVAVCMADELGCHLATDHLLGLGHRRIGYLGISDKSSVGKDRLSGYLAAHRNYGVEPMEGGVKLLPPRKESGQSGAGHLLSLKQRPTAMVVGSSELTIGTLKAARSIGLTVPNDLSIVGFGDPVWFDLLEPAITTVSLPVFRLAERASEELFQRLRAGDGAESIGGTIPPERPKLVVRGSTAQFEAP